MSELVNVENKNVVPRVDNKTVEDFLFTTETKLTDKQKQMFLAMAVKNNLDPFKREIYAIPFGKGFNIVTGYQVYIQRAEKTGLLNGWDVEAIYDKDNNLQGAKITIHRKDWEKPFEWKVSLKEFHRDMGNWKIMPEFMIKKVAMAQGFRLAFPNELGSLPYTEDELPTASQNQNTNSDIDNEFPNFKFLKQMEEVKKNVGEEVYYRVLKAHGYEKSNQITNRDEAIKIYQELKNIAKDLK